MRLSNTMHMLRGTITHLIAAIAVAATVALPVAFGAVDSGGNSGAGSTTGQTLVNPLKVGTLPELLKLVLEAVVYLGSIVLTLAIIWVGFKFVAAQGNPEKIKEARNALVWTLIGGLILLGAQAISLAIQSTVGSLQAK